MKALRALLLAAVFTACQDVTGPQDATLHLSALLTGTTVDQLVVTVSAPDLPTSLVFNITVQNGTASGTLRLPPGDDRLIQVQAVDQTGEVTHEGNATVDVHPGQNPPVSILLRSRAGQVPIVVTIAEVIVVVSPNPASVSVGGTLQLTAAILGPNNQPVSGTVTWATSNPAFAKVDDQGMVTGLAAGQVLIVAVSEGVAGVSQLTVSSGTPGTGPVIITEFMANPNVVADAAGEWLELFNPTNNPVNIEGWMLMDDGTDVHVFNNNGLGLMVPPGGFLVIGSNGQVATNGGVPVQYQYGNFTLANTADEIVLKDGQGNTVDRVAYDLGFGWPILAGRSTSLSPSTFDVMLNDVASSWCPSVTPIGLFLDTGTPGQPNDPCPDSGLPTIQSLLPPSLTLVVGQGGVLDVTISSPAGPGGVFIQITVQGGSITAPPGVTIMEGSTVGVIPLTAVVPGPAQVIVSLNGTTASSNVEVMGSTAVNETDLAVEADFCNLQFPVTATMPAGGLLSIFGQLFEAGLTEPIGPRPQVLAAAGYGPVASDPRFAPGWVFVPAAFNIDQANNDEYRAVLQGVPPGMYSTVFRFSIDLGMTWTYCDVDGAGSNPGVNFEIGNLGSLTVTP